MGTSKNFELEDMKIVIDNVTQDALSIFKLCNFSTACKSRIISEMLEENIAKYFGGQRAKTDREPDVYFPDLNSFLEIKVTRIDGKYPKRVKFQGGGYSKRPGQYLLFTWSEPQKNLFDKTSMNFRYANTYIQEDDWKSADKGKGTYYAKDYYHPTEEFIVL